MRAGVAHLGGEVTVELDRRVRVGVEQVLKSSCLIAKTASGAARTCADAMASSITPFTEP